MAPTAQLTNCEAAAYWLMRGAVPEPCAFQPTPMVLLLRMTNSPNLFDPQLQASMNVIDSFLNFPFDKV